MLFWSAVVWVVIGFLYGCKIVFVEKIFNEMKSKAIDENGDKMYNFSMKNKFTFILVCSLSGIIIPLIESMFILAEKQQGREK